MLKMHTNTYQHVSKQYLKAAENQTTITTNIEKQDFELQHQRFIHPKQQNTTPNQDTEIQHVSEIHETKSQLQRQTIHRFSPSSNRKHVVCLYGRQLLFLEK